MKAAISLVLREMQIKFTINYFIFDILAITQVIDKTMYNTCKGMVKYVLLYVGDGSKNSMGFNFPRSIKIIY